MSLSWGSLRVRELRLRAIGWLIAVALLPGLSLAAAQAPSGPDHSRDDGHPVDGLPLADVITALEASGEVFVYSSDLIRPDTLIDVPDRRPFSLDDLRRGLRALDLTLERGTGQSWLIVPIDTRERGAPPPASVEGRVLDAQSGEPVAGVRVEIGGLVLYTDAQGRFRFPASGVRARPAQAVHVSRDGYQSRQIEAAPSLDALLEIPLDPRPEIEEIIVVSSRYALRGSHGGSVHTIDAYELDAVPEIGDDALRVANHLPGAATIGLSAAPHFRGGLRDETLVLFNGVELLEPFHLRDFQSVFSGFNPSLVKSVDVYTGGFPARYGDRMSAVLDIEAADDIDRFGAELMLSFLTASASAVGVVDEGRGRWSASARRGNLDLVVDLVNKQVGDPTYSDLFGSFAYELAPLTEVEAGFIVYNDDVLLQELDDLPGSELGVEGEQAESRYKNAYVWTQLHHQWGPRTFSSTVISYGDIRHKRKGFIVDEDPEEGSSTLDDDRSFDLWNIGHRQQWRYSDQLGFEFGAEYAYQSGRYDTRAQIIRGELAELTGLTEEETRRVLVDPDGASGDAYGSVRILPADWLALELGVRWDFQDFGDDFEQQFSPRFSALIDLGDDTQLRASAGRFHQAEQIHELQAADGVEHFQLPQYSDHYILGVSHRFANSGVSARVEGFYKRIRDPKRRYENLFNALVLMPELASDRVAVEPEEAQVRGLEATLRYQPNDAFRSWLSYTRSRAEDRIDGDWQRRGWDQTHAISSGFLWQARQWAFSAAVLWHSGWQTTRLPDLIDADNLLALERNSSRLPDYLSVDVRIARSWHWPRQTLTLFAEITNLLNHENVGAYEYSLEEIEDSDDYRVISEPVTLLPLVPSIGVRWTFD
ncbi:MAG: TonB-dependent receptor [Pseudomonadales bacterium]|nr:TonB-dependent receptor [Pseudomonadales bacterium]